MSTENCSLQATVNVVGGKWSLLVLREMFNGVGRFEEIRRHLGVSEAVLTRRLRELEAEGVIESRTYREPGQRGRREYRLTGPGRDLFPVLIALLQWGDRHRAPEEGGSWEVRHRACDARVVSAVLCPEHPEAVLSHRDTVTQPGPSASTMVGSTRADRSAG